MLAPAIYKESPFKALKLLVLILGSIFLFFWALIISDEFPQMTQNGLNKSAELLLIIFSIFGGFLFITFLILSFQYRKIVKLNSSGGEILEKNFWSSGISETFKWKDVLDTNIEERQQIVNTTEGQGIVSIYTFVIKTDKGRLPLLDLKNSKKRDINGLINYVNEATPHLKYVWIKQSKVNNQLEIDLVDGFSKVEKNV